ncbi:CotH protein [Lacinutrix venerupis]|uniref:CotH kinase family protein n=1 Tax=Lacinutrix venerupis TaxID=1486034 RepID=UPI000EAB72A9|nr:CotH kinase family protein [Lacinutrix venerupis]RLJ64429.1 CotH protein [Lacinutrix venerupis]
MKYLSQLTLMSFILLFLTQCSAQDMVTADQGSFGVDKKNKIIVWHQQNLDAILSKNKNIVSINFNEDFSLKNTSKKLSYNEGINVTNGDDYTLYISKIPLIHITIDTENMTNESKIAGNFTYYNNKEFIESVMGVRYRGNLSLSFPKKSFDIEFWTDKTSQEKKDLKFKGMRSDDDWILDGMYNEPLRLHSDVATNLWLDIQKPYYLDKEPEAKNGFEVKYVELFKNNEYYGIYQFSESVDRKQLQIKKSEGNVVNGELYKANSYDGGPDFTKAPEKFNNLFPHWSGWRTEYPFINYKSHFENLFELQQLVVKGTDESFSNNIANKVNIENVINYYLFVNAMRATDNLGKNYYLGKYNKNEPYFFVAWDLDGVLGIIRDGEREHVSDFVLGNGLFNRLIKLNPNNFNQKLKDRWIALRANEFSNDALLSRIDKVYNKFTKEKIYEREQLVWINKLNENTNKEHYEYLKTSLENRLTFLDNHFKSL